MFVIGVLPITGGMLPITLLLTRRSVWFRP
ncbi:MAG: hypothetical protein AVDCRST_MAG28-3732 [uncultured Rubrobacteraceae bacterium]|uniref:Uncharacterized protein n=1 Tax=uncultured Rubrobacteraceae bacterium TaxID=349277 RepID=A0A6J4REZ5_9ACTN|nr:MAG: hypothetical protein AVDCRST_MAG28-3732 [uncultured Rubrobacteraceae bacterium]